jgi:hypothetical protein
MAWWGRRRSRQARSSTPLTASTVASVESGDIKALTQGVTIRPHGCPLTKPSVWTMQAPISTPPQPARLPTEASMRWGRSALGVVARLQRTSRSESW